MFALQGVSGGRAYPGSKHGNLAVSASDHMCKLILPDQRSVFSFDPLKRELIPVRIQER